MKGIFFDTETTGLPKNWKASMRDVDNWPRVIQLAWVVCEGGELIKEEKHLILPVGWVMPTEKFWIDNGFSQEKSLKEGSEIEHVLTLFLADHSECDYMVSHNMSFDYNVLGAEFIRSGMKGDKTIRKICTKEMGTDLCELPGPYGWKWPKLIELHEFLFNKGFDGAHDALADVKACMRCFFEMVNRGSITLS